MVLIDERNWPLALVRWETPVESADLSRYRDDLRAWAARACRFVILTIQPAASDITQPARDFDWLAQHRGHLQSHCAGVALLWPDGRCEETAHHDASLAEQHLGCPARGFLDSDSALRWLRGRLQACTDTPAPASTSQPPEPT